MMPNKKIAIIGGGTNTYVSNHLALSAPAYGTTAKTLKRKFEIHDDNKMHVDLYLTKMAGGNPIQSLQKNLDYNINKLNTHLTSCHRKLVEQRRDFYRDSLKHQGVFDTPEDIEALVDNLIADPDTRVIIFNVAMVDYKPTSLFALENNAYDAFQPHEITHKFGKYATRLNTSKLPEVNLELTVQDKIINKIRKERKDILLVGFKTTCGATKEEQFHKGLKLCKDASANIVFVNDVDKDRIEALNMVNKLLESYEENIPSLPAGMQIFKQTAKYINIMQEIESTEKEVLTKLRDTYQNNGLVTPEESSYWYNTRDEALDALAQMVLDRSHLHFTRSTVVDSETVSWNITRRVPGKIYTLGEEPAVKPTIGPREITPNPLIPETFRTVFDWVRQQGAYKLGPTKSTVGHFGIALGPNEFLTSKRKTDFNKIEEVGLVRVITDDPDDVFGYKHFFQDKYTQTTQQIVELEIYLSKLKIWDRGRQETIDIIKDLKYSLLSLKEEDKVIAFGAKPSVGGQSQRSLFDAYPNLDCIVHFHCPLKPESRELFTTTKQFSYECGSKECIASNLTGFKEYKVSDTHSIWAGHMDYHGPNIVFNSNINPQFVIDFISSHWDLSKKTTGLSDELI